MDIRRRFALGDGGSVRSVDGVVQVAGRRVAAVIGLEQSTGREMRAALTSPVGPALSLSAWVCCGRRSRSGSWDPSSRRPRCRRSSPIPRRWHRAETSVGPSAADHLGSLVGCADHGRRHYVSPWSSFGWHRLAVGPERHLDIAPGRIGVRADLVGCGHDRNGALGIVDSRKRHIESHGHVESSVLGGNQADLRFDRRRSRDPLALAVRPRRVLPRSTPRSQRRTAAQDSCLLLRRPCRRVCGVARPARRRWSRRALALGHRSRGLWPCRAMWSLSAPLESRAPDATVHRFSILRGPAGSIKGVLPCSIRYETVVSQHEHTGTRRQGGHRDRRRGRHRSAPPPNCSCPRGRAS